MRDDVFSMPFDLVNLLDDTSLLTECFVCTAHVARRIYVRGNHELEFVERYLYELYAHMVYAICSNKWQS